MGVRTLVPDALERSPIDHLVGTCSHAAAHACSGIRPRRYRRAPRTGLGWAAMSGMLCDDAGIPGVRAAGDHRHSHLPVLGADDLAVAKYVAFAQQEDGHVIRAGIRGSFAFEILLWTAVFRLCRSRSQYAYSCVAGTACGEDCAPQMAPARLVEHPQRNAMGGVLRLPGVLHFFVEPVHRHVQRHTPRSGVASASPSADAALDLPPRLGWLCV